MLHPSPTLSPVPTRQQSFSQLPVLPARRMTIDPLPGFDITASQSRLPVYGTEFTFESSRAFQSPADAVSFSYGGAYVPPLIETSGFALKLINENGLDLSANVDSLYPGQRPVFDAACQAGWNAAWSQTSIPPWYGSASRQAMFQTQASERHTSTPFLSGLEAPTVNPAMILQNIPYGSSTSTRMSSVSVTSPSSVQSAITLFGDSDAFTASSGLCIATPRAFSRESTLDIPTAGPAGGGMDRQSSRVSNVLVVGPSEWTTNERARLIHPTGPEIPYTDTEPAEMSGGVARFDRKRKHDVVRRTMSCST
jgi:hypothetical protein